MQTPAAARGPSLLVRILVSLMLLATTTAAAGVARAQSPSVAPDLMASADMDAVVDFEAIQATPVSIDADPSGRSAVISVGTSIDAACAVVFGEDGTFGQLATDRDMAGAAHRDHQVVLGGLQPATTYVFRLQGSGIDGRLYRSQVYSFSTPAPPTSASADLAVGARIDDVSSEYSEAFSASNAVDGDPTTEWSTLGDGDSAFITLDLGRLVDISAVAFRTREMSDGSAITRTFTVTVDGTTLGPFPASKVVPVEVTAQVLRFDIEASSGGNTGATAIEVFGTEHAAP